MTAIPRSPSPALARMAAAVAVIGLACARAAAAETGSVTVEVVLAIGTPPLSANVSVELSQGETVIAASDQPNPRFTVPAGRYTARATSGLATGVHEFRLLAGDDQRLKVTLEAGVLAVQSRRAESLQLYQMTTDVFGERPLVAETAGNTWTVLLPRGQYILRATGGGDVIAERTVRIVPGRRTQVGMP